MLQASTGLRNKLLDTNPLKTILNLGKINIYAGTIPANADADIGSATLLCTITNNSTATGLTFANDAAGGIIAKNASETWSGVNADSGTATFYRHVTAADDGTYSTTQARLQGTVGLAGADMNLSDISLVASATQTLDYYTVNLPSY